MHILRTCVLTMSKSGTFSFFLLFLLLCISSVAERLQRQACACVRALSLEHGHRHVPVAPARPTAVVVAEELPAVVAAVPLELGRALATDDDAALLFPEAAPAPDAVAPPVMVAAIRTPGVDAVVATVLCVAPVTTEAALPGCVTFRDAPAVPATEARVVPAVVAAPAAPLVPVAPSMRVSG